MLCIVFKNISTFAVIFHDYCKSKNRLFERNKNENAKNRERGEKQRSVYLIAHFIRDKANE